MTCKKENRRETVFYGTALALSLAACLLQESLSVYLGLFFVFVMVLCRLLSASKTESVAKTAGRLFRLAVTLVVPVCILILLVQILVPLPEAFGTNRGRIWAEARAFLKTFGPKEWLFGTGQDLFCLVLEDNPDFVAFLAALTPPISRVSNAHAELLNILVTTGLAGLCTFLALLSAILRKALKALQGEHRLVALCSILVTGSYLANNTVSFRQILSTPLLYILAGILFSTDQKDVEI